MTFHTMTCTNQNRKKTGRESGSHFCMKKTSWPQHSHDSFKIHRDRNLTECSLFALKFHISFTWISFSITFTQRLAKYNHALLCFIAWKKKSKVSFPLSCLTFQDKFFRFSSSLWILYIIKRPKTATHNMLHVVVYKIPNSKSSYCFHLGVNSSQVLLIKCTSSYHHQS